jgi:hypothetical protein
MLPGLAGKVIEGSTQQFKKSMILGVRLVLFSEPQEAVYSVPFGVSRRSEMVFRDRKVPKGDIRGSAENDSSQPLTYTLDNDFW